MLVNCSMDNARIVKAGVKITFFAGGPDAKEILRHLSNFVDKPLTVDVKVDADEQQARMSQITDEQRKKLYVLFKDVADFTGDNSEAVKINFKALFRKAYDYPDFSLSNCEKELASEFIGYAVAWCLEWSIGLNHSPLELVDDLQAYLYVCLQYKKCCICGKEAETHHWNAIGMGRDRRHYDDSDHRKIALCRVHHTEVETIGRDTFAEKYHVEGVVMK